MATRTARYTANSSYIEIVAGPKEVLIQPITGFCDLYVGTSTPNANEANTWILKPVAGENHLDVVLETGDKIFIRAHNGVKGATLCWIEQAVPA